MLVLTIKGVVRKGTLMGNPAVNQTLRRASPASLTILTELN